MATVLAAACVAAAVELTPEQQVEILSQAQREFDRGVALRPSDPAAAQQAFERAAAGFQALAAAGIRNGKLYYNLGNAYLESGRLGEAILNYRRAEELIPGDPQLEANLRYARSLRQDQIGSSGGRAFVKTLFFWHYGTPLRWRYAAGLAAYVVFWLLMIGWTFLPRYRWRYVTVPVLMIWITLAGSVLVDVMWAPRSRSGVITTEEIIVRKGNGEGFDPQLEQPLHEGVEFQLIEQRRDWLHVELPDGKRGWIPARAAKLI